MKRTQILFCSFFLFIIILPVPVFFSFYSMIPHESTENKALTGFPQFQFSEYTSFPKNFETWFIDHLPFKEQMVHLSRVIEYKIFHRFDETESVLGKNQWFFYRKTLRNYKGIDSFSSKEQQKITENAEYIAQWLSERGVKSSFLIAPDKEQVYPELMPDYVKRISENNRGEGLSQFIYSHSQIKWIYPKKQLSEISVDLPVYFSTDTHWNDLSGCIAANWIVAELDPSFTHLSCQFESSISEGMDLSNMVSMKKVIREKNAVTILYDDEIVSEKTGSVDYGRIQRFHSNAENQEKIVILGDSFGEYLIEPLNHFYSDVIFLKYGSLPDIDLQAEGITKFSLVLVERNLSFLLDGIY